MKYVTVRRVYHIIETWWTRKEEGGKGREGKMEVLGTKQASNILLQDVDR